MTDRDHTTYREEIGAYLLGALTDLERQDFDVLSHRPRLGAVDAGWVAWRVLTWVPR